MTACSSSSDLGLRGRSSRQAFRWDLRARRSQLLINCCGRSVSVVDGVEVGAVYVLDGELDPGVQGVRQLRSSEDGEEERRWVEIGRSDLLVRLARRASQFGSCQCG